MSRTLCQREPIVGVDDLREKLRSAIRARGYQLDVDLNADVQDDRLVVSGVVPSFHVRQIVMDCARRSAQCLMVDRLKVHSPRAGAAS